MALSAPAGSIPHPGRNASEFVITEARHYDRRSAARWLLSHVFRYKIFLASVFGGAFANAACAFSIPLLVGLAFNAILKPQPDMNTLVSRTLLIFLPQFIRPVFVASRTTSTETIA